MLRNYIFLSFAIGFLQFAAAATYGQCTTPKQEISTCVELEQCDALYKTLQKINLTPEERMFLSQSQCGFMNGKVLVCCPPDTPEGVGEKRGQFNNPLFPRAPTCGIGFSNRIYGGNITALDEYPWMALIEYTKPGNRKGFNCGGALINDRYVITAAHCVLAVPSDWRLTGVRLGDWDLNTNPDCVTDVRGKEDCNTGYVDIEVEERTTHPSYSPRARSQENDIALLRLRRKVTYNDFIKPICLPYVASMRSETYEDREMDVAGWGRTEVASASNVKLKATIKGWNFQRCKTKYTSQRINLNSKQMCAGGESGIDSCKGDSGGPLVAEERVNNRQIFFLIGVVSFGPNPCGLAGWPGVYTRVADYMDWIDNTVRA